jgi:hypothetical protein
MRSIDELRNWINEYPNAVHVRASSVFGQFIEQDRILRSRGEPWVNRWRWEDAIAEILDMPRDSDLVAAIGKALRTDEHSYRPENYDPSRFERLLDRFQRHLETRISGEGS